MLLSGLHNLGKHYNKQVSKIVHDEQSEFGQYLQQMYKYLSGVNIVDVFQLFPVVEDTDMFPDTLEFSSSSTSPFLQLIDVSLWLVKQKVDHNKTIYGRTGILLNNIIERSTISHFTRSHLQAEVHHYTQLIMNAPIAESKLAIAKETITEIDKLRKINLEQNP